MVVPISRNQGFMGICGAKGLPQKMENIKVIYLSYTRIVPKYFNLQKKINAILCISRYSYMQFYIFLCSN